MNDKVREILYIALAIIIAVLLVRFIIWLLPIILIAIIAFIIYAKIKGNDFKDNNKDKKKIVIIEEKKNK